VNPYIKNLFLLFSILPLLSFAQKLPNVQQVSLRAPTNVKIDGKPTEWGDKLQAYNKGTGLYYTMANDDTNLYLIIKTDDVDALVKITNRGLVFNINKHGRKEDKDVISFCYPVFDIENKPYISFKNKITINPKVAKTVSDADSAMRSSNKRINDRAKFIKVSGLPAIDSMLSIYNDKGIAAAQLFDNTMTYTYEFVVPLTLLRSGGSDVSKFSYHIIVPATTENDFMIVKRGSNGMPTSIIVRPGAGGTIPSQEHLAATLSTTDFLGEYTLAK
jgi:hypothetical protein